MEESCLAMWEDLFSQEGACLELRCAPVLKAHAKQPLGFAVLGRERNVAERGDGLPGELKATVHANGWGISPSKPNLGGIPSRVHPHQPCSTCSSCHAGTHCRTPAQFVPCCTGSP